MSSILAGITRPGSREFKNPAPHASPGMVSRLKLAVRGPDGVIKQETPWLENIMGTFGLASLASMVGSGAGVNASTWVSTMRIGTGTTAATSTDTSLVASTGIVHITQASLTKTNLGNRTVQYEATFLSSNPAGAAQINEVAMYANSTAESQVVGRVVLGTASVNKGASDQILTSYQVVFTTA